MKRHGLGCTLVAAPRRYELRQSSRHRFGGEFEDLGSALPELADWVALENLRQPLPRAAHQLGRQLG